MYINVKRHNPENKSKLLISNFLSPIIGLNSVPKWQCSSTCIQCARIMIVCNIWYNVYCYVLYCTINCYRLPDYEKLLPGCWRVGLPTESGIGNIIPTMERYQVPDVCVTQKLYIILSLSSSWKYWKIDKSVHGTYSGTLQYNNCDTKAMV